MILDKKLQLASNLDIGSGARDSTGIRISDLLPTSGLGDAGNGKTLYACFTVTQSFAANNAGTESLFNFSIRHAFGGFPDLVVAFTDPLACMYSFRLQPLMGQTGFIPNKGSNFVAGKKFIFPLSMFSHKSQLTIGADNVPGIVGPLPTSPADAFIPGEGTPYIYAVIEETGAGLETVLTNPVSSIPQDNVASGRLDIDIVTISEPGAGPGFSDGYYYPVGTKVQ